MSAPTQWLVDHSLVHPGMSVFDYGCGRGTDGKYLEALGCRVGKYDPFYFPDPPTDGDQYDLVTCHYVLNVIEDPVERTEVLANVIALLNPEGRAFVTVRGDVKHLHGYTKAGTYQTLILLDRPWALVPRTPGTFRMYQYDTKGESLS